MNVDAISYNASAQALKSLYYSYACAETQIPIFVEADLYDSYKAVSDQKYLKTIDRSGHVLVVRPDATFHALCGEGKEPSSE
ncbi:MAG: hypothetical protein LBC69_02255, partial [Eubacteriaceae bacterium]|nr:hypothetical protein [Eubacteriaceae bacterium]